MRLQLRVLAVEEVIEETPSLQYVAAMGTGKRPASADEAKAMGHPLRLRILRLCLDEELTNRELADRLGKDPGTVLHHVRMLVDTGFLAEGTPRRGKRNSRERPYLATRKSWVLDFAADHAAIDVAAAEAFAAELRESPPDAPAPWWTRLALRLSPEDHRELADRLRDVVADMERRDHPGGEPVSIYLALHRPNPTATNQEETA